MLSQAAAASIKDWLADPRWWLRNPAYAQPELQVDGERLPEVVETLRVIYDEDTCRGMIDSGYWAPLVGLFSGAGYLEWFGIMLAVGVDALACPDAIRDEHLLSRLRTGNHWLGARLELGAWAGLRRHGFAARRPQAGKSAKNFDLLLEDAPSVAIECKTLSSGNADGNLELVQHAFQGTMFAVIGKDRRCDAELMLSDHMVELIWDTPAQRFLDSVRGSFIVALERALTMAFDADVAYPVGDYGSVVLRAPTIEAPFLGHWEVTGGYPSDLHRYRRLMQAFGDATANLSVAPASVHRIAVVWTGQRYVDSAQAGAFIGDNIGNVITGDGTRVTVDRARLGFDTGIIIGAIDAADRAGWKMDAATILTRERPVSPVDEVCRALCDWQFHVPVTRNDGAARAAVRR